MKKVGVLTFHRSLNYGAILQAYGLVKSIEKLGYKSELLDYRNNKLEERDSLKRYIKTKGFMRNLYQIFEFPFWCVRRKRFNKFLEIINTSNKITKIDKSIEEKYETLFVGSDQVWNHRVTDFDENYFFNNICDKTKVNSYAASFGISKIPVELEETYKLYLSKFSCISVREEVGSELVSKLVDKKPKVVIDPSLLLNKDEWSEIIPHSKIKERYILIYQRAYSESLIKFAEKLALRTGCSIITINGNPRQPIKGKYVLNAGPLEWLQLVRDAEYIVTNSFHGVAFSINLEKKFYVELLDEKFGVNSRLVNIIDKFNVEDRLINNINEDNISNDIDYVKINSVLKHERRKAFEYIDSTIKNRGF